MGDAHDAFSEEWARWHDEVEARRRSPRGYLAITGLHWLGAEPTRYDGAPGAWSCDERGVHLVLDGAATLDGLTLGAGAHELGALEPEESRWLVAGPVVVEVARRGARPMIRPRRGDAPVLRAYRGTPCFTPDVAWVAQGSFTPHATSRTVTVGSSVEGLEDDFESPGVVGFTLEGQHLRLTAFTGEPGELYFLFADATSGVTTYSACRQLSAPVPDREGRVALDFNRATNLPCAYTPFTTCPLPPGENRLGVGVEAGERLPAASDVDSPPGGADIP